MSNKLHFEVANGIPENLYAKLSAHIENLEKTGPLVKAAEEALASAISNAESERAQALDILAEITRAADRYKNRKGSKWEATDEGSSFVDWLSNVNEALDALDNEITDGSEIADIIEDFNSKIQQTPEAA
jgi:flagellar biosynthesis chaperone FliJ